MVYCKPPLVSFTQNYNLSEYSETLKGFIPGPEYPDLLLSLNGPPRRRLAFLSRQEHRIIEPDLGGVGGS